MRTRTLEQVSTQVFVGLQIDFLQRLKNGNMSLEQWEWFKNLPFTKREKLMGRLENEIKTRTQNPTFTVTPVNDIQGNLDKFDWYYDWLKRQNMKFKVESHGDSLTVELIKCKPAGTEGILKQIDELGFISVPSPYILGLGVQYPEVIKKYGYIVSLDENNLLPREGGSPSFLHLFWYGERILNLAIRDGGWDGGWWFAVVRKNLVS